MPGYLSNESVFEFTVDEDGYVNGLEVLEIDIENDYAQIIRTTAIDRATGSKYAANKKLVNFDDVVEYKNLIIGREYLMHTVLMVQETGQPLLDGDGNQVTSETRFVPKTPDGNVTVTVAFDASLLGGQSLVFFEKLFVIDLETEEETEIANHEDIDDEGQTVHVVKVNMWSNASVFETGGQIAEPVEGMVIVDSVNHENLVIGANYVMRGVLMDKDSGQPLLLNGEMVTAEQRFVPESRDGKVNVRFAFDASTLAGKDIVIYERLYHEEDELLDIDENLDNKNQTIRFSKPKKGTISTSTPPNFRNGSRAPRSGDDFNMIIWIALIGISVIAGSTVVCRKKRNKQK